MDSFTRTNSGLANQHAFYNCDYVVFLEGGEISYNVTDVYSGSFNENTNDIIFWENIFKKFLKHKKIKFKSVGSKTTVKDIGNDIMNANITTVMVAMDSEFDQLHGGAISHPNILYSKGYSWENDVWCPDVINSVLKQVTAKEIAEADIKTNIINFFQNISIGVAADAYLFLIGDSFFSRSGTLKCVDCQSKDLPFVKSDVIKALLKEKNLKTSMLTQFKKQNSINSAEFCFGHLLADYCVQVINHYLKNRENLSAIRKDILNRIALGNYFNEHFVQAKSFKYYEALF